MTGSFSLPKPFASSPSESQTPGSLKIVFCDGCGWFARSQWYSYELFQTFHTRRLQKGLEPLISETTIAASENAGDWRMEINNQLVWDRRTDGGFPDLKLVKNRVKEVLDPSVDLGHSEIKCSNSSAETGTETDASSLSSGFETHLFIHGDESDVELDEDEMLQMRRMWGVM
ncbi:hypothetical protein TrST_g13301 [Triparma strigata]|uniref:SelT-like protein n=1 Tax=Triparma strigata TaxID=1606541 RepID=A0A9W7BBT5_9STRA|nr:hypothetical protein TrST_g13301 [Triparma strigata]